MSYIVNTSCRMTVGRWNNVGLIVRCVILLFMAAVETWCRWREEVVLQWWPGCSRVIKKSTEDTVCKGDGEGGMERESERTQCSVLLSSKDCNISCRGVVMLVYGGREGHSEYGYTSRTPYPAFCETGSRDRYTPVSGFCNRGLRSPGLIVGADAWLRTEWSWNSRLRIAQHRTPDCRTYEYYDNGRGLVLSCDGGPRSSQMFI